MVAKSSQQKHLSKASIRKRPAFSPKPAELLSLAELQQQRAALGSLKERRVSERTLSLYNKALSWFFAFLHRYSLSIPADEPTFDDLLADAIDVAWASGFSRTFAGHILSLA